MPEYIGRNTQMLGALLAAQSQGANQKTATQQKIAEAVAGAINKHYESKEKKIAETKANKIKESMALIEFVKNFETRGSEAAPNIPGLQGMPGAGIQPAAPSIGPAEQVSIRPEGYEPIPQAIRSMGVQGEYMRPRDRQYKPYESAGEAEVAAYNKEYGTSFPPGTSMSVIRADAANRRPQGQKTLGKSAESLSKVYPNLNFTADTPITTANTMISQARQDARLNITMDMRRNAYAKMDPAYQAVSKKIMNLPADRSLWEPQEEANWEAWVEATKKRGITIEDVRVVSENADEESLGIFGTIARWLNSAYYGERQAAKPGAPAPKPGGRAPAKEQGGEALPGLFID